jgi:serine/threonine protein kinase/tetratricopeptide (TPR) repeat protein
MDPTRWGRVQSLFSAALEQSPSERDFFLRNECAGDEDLYHEVISLLQADSDGHSILEGSAVDAVGLPGDVSLEGKLVGVYRIAKQVGAGGMGAVYLAERADGQFEQKVALKFIKRGMDSEEILRRFQSERQILAQLQHPNVARLLDGGITEDGLPYFTMEYVEGQPIDVYCDSHEHTIEERLHLFQTVCSTVQYAHRNLVVHRDLKPSNIMVTEDGTLKLLDFGISKVLTSTEDAAEATGLTRLGLKIMTPEYASPEQARGEPVTTTSDVYSLGIILYELLTGHRPYKFPTRSPIEIENVIHTTEPKKPSTIVQQTETDESGTTTTPELISRTRRTLPEKLRKRLAGDLDNICMKALRKEPEQRYTSADQLLQDITAHLNGQPVSARPATVGYRLQKFVRRHKAGVLTAATVFAVVAGLVAFYTTRLAEERDFAQLEARKAAQVSEFLSDLFKVSDPSESRGERITARELLERGAQRIESDLKNQPRVQATMMGVVGNVYRALGLYNDATPLLEKSLALRRSLYGENHPEVATGLNDLGNLLRQAGDYTRSDSVFQSALTLRERFADGPSLGVAESMNDLAILLTAMGRHDEADSFLHASLGIRERLLGPEDNRVAETLNNIAVNLQSMGEYDRADSIMRSVLGLRRKAYGEKHPSVSTALSSLGFILQDKGERNEAEALFRQALALNLEMYGQDHPEISTDMYHVATILQLKGEYDSAEVMFRRVLALDKKLLGDEHPFIAPDINNVASVLSEKGDLKGAEALHHEALALNRKVLGEEHPEVATSMSNLGVVLNKQGRYDDAEPWLRQALALRQKIYGEKHPHVVISLNILASLLNNQGKNEESLALYRRVLALRTELIGERHPQTANTMISLGGLLVKVGRADSAEAYLKTGLEVLAEKLPSDHWEIANTKSQLGGCQTVLKKYAEAERFLLDGYRGLKEKRGEADRFTQQALRRIITLYEKMGKQEDAEAYRSIQQKKM